MGNIIYLPNIKEGGPQYIANIIIIDVFQPSKANADNIITMGDTKKKAQIVYQT